MRNPTTLATASQVTGARQVYDVVVTGAGIVAIVCLSRTRSVSYRMPQASRSVNVPRAIDASPEKTMISESQTTLRLLRIRALSFRAIVRMARILLVLCAIFAAASLGVHVTERRQRTMVG